MLLPMTLHRHSCHLCNAGCGLLVETAGRDVVSIRPNPNDVFSKGYICPKAFGLQDIHHDPDRLHTPLKRTGDSWQEISWQQALREVGRRLRKIRTLYGDRAVAIYQGNPTVHNLGALTHGQLFFQSIRTPHRYTAQSMDNLPHGLASLSMFGNQAILPVPDLERTDFLLMLGANPVVSGGSAMIAPDMKRRLRTIIARGGAIVTLDPRRTESSHLASEHVFIRPGSDAAFLFSILFVLFEEGRIALGRFANKIEGLKELRELCAAFCPEVVTYHCGVEAQVIRRLAIDFANADHAVCYGRIGVCTQRFGGLAAWLINVLNTVTANLDEKGGAMFCRAPIDLAKISELIGMRGSFDRYRSRVQGLPEYGGEYPVIALATEIETPGPGQVRALITHAGNPVLSFPDAPRFERALSNLDFFVAIDIYKNETTRYADYILPPTFGLENDYYEFASQVVSVRRVARYSEKLFERNPNQRYDWEIFLGLLEKSGPFSALLTAVARRWPPRRIVDAFMRLGPYGALRDGLTVSRAVAAEGLDYGFLEPRLRSLLGSRSIELVPPIYASDVTRLRASMNEKPSELVLIGRRSSRSNNSWMHNSPRLTSGKSRCVLLMNPADAKARNIVEASLVTVKSATGELRVPVALTTDLMPGVVSMPHGFGHNEHSSGLGHASTVAGANANRLTSIESFDKLSGTAALSGEVVSVFRTP